MKNWIITGASTGIGRGIALAALKHGDRVIVTSRSVEKLESLSEQYPETCIPAKLELSSKQSIADFIKFAKGKFSQVDVLVNNAGYGYLATVEEGKRQEIKDLFDVNLFGPIELMQAFLPQMREDKEGVIVNVSSVNAIKADPGSSFYAASKAALSLLTEGMEREVAPFNIKVMVVEPGGFNTDFYGLNLKETKSKIADYNKVDNIDRKKNIQEDYQAPGDPVKAGEVIYDAVNDPASPTHLLLGSDAVDAAEKKLNDQLTQIEKWENTSKKTDSK